MPYSGWIDWYNLTYFSDHVYLMSDHALGDYINLCGLYHNELICILTNCKEEF